MANTELLPMHSDFARWHACIGLGDDEARRLSRWAGVSAVAQAADSKDIEVLIRLAFSRAASPLQLHRYRKFGSLLRRQIPHSKCMAMIVSFRCWPVHHSLL